MCIKYILLLCSFTIFIFILFFFSINFIVRRIINQSAHVEAHCNNIYNFHITTNKDFYLLLK